MKTLWKLGHLQCGFSKCNSKYCKPRTFQQFNFRPSKNCHSHVSVYGHCTRHNGQNERVYLGWYLNYAEITIAMIKQCIANNVLLF